MATTDEEVRALHIESLKLVVQAEALLGRLQVHQGDLQRWLDERRQRRQVGQVGQGRP